jgi:CRISPR/Cas system-associated exonuclease Cas4 (RecB family)
LFKDEFAQLKLLYAAGKVSLEGKWGFNDEWEPRAWNSADIWARIKLDAFVTITTEEAVVVDYKTGRKVGNEIKHADQMQLYQLSAFMLYPKLEQITVELWYLDQDDTTKTTFTREQGMRFFRNFDARARKMTDTVEFTPKPNKFVCGRCPYKTICEHSAANTIQKKHIAPHSNAARDFKPWE